MLADYNTLPDDALVLVYQADKNLSVETVAAIDQKIQSFISGWTSHQTPVQGYGKVYHNRFIILFADETQHGVSGCSKDKVTHLLKEIEEQFQLNVFNRLQVAYLDDADEVSTVELQELPHYFESGKLDVGTIIFNNLVSNKKDWELKWKQALQDSPFSKFIVQKAN